MTAALRLTALAVLVSPAALAAAAQSSAVTTDYIRSNCLGAWGEETLSTIEAISINGAEVSVTYDPGVYDHELMVKPTYTFDVREMDITYPFEGGSYINLYCSSRCTEVVSRTYRLNEPGEDIFIEEESHLSTGLALECRNKPGVHRAMLHLQELTGGATEDPFSE